jgi:glutamate-1-semialdehyde 2,1-aminomutase/spore coat polysaccharide biosynthesis protein SpsF
MKNIEILQRDNVPAEIQRNGQALIEHLRLGRPATPAQGRNSAATVWMFFVTFRKDEQKTYKNRRRDFYTYAIRKGVFIQPYHHGYVAYRHTEQDLAGAARVMDEALQFVEQKYGR